MKKDILVTGMKKKCSEKFKKDGPKKKSRTGLAIFAQLSKNTIVRNNCVVIFLAEKKPNISKKYQIYVCFAGQNGQHGQHEKNAECSKLYPKILSKQLVQTIQQISFVFKRKTSEIIVNNFTILPNFRKN